MNTLVIMFLTFVGILGIIALFLYLLASFDIFLGMVPEGEIIAVMVSDKVKFYIGNISGFWVHPETGILTAGEVPATEKENMPWNIFGLGIFWLGIWPFAERYSYPFPHDKYRKKENNAGYEIVSKDDIADSVYFRASYPITIEAITKDFVPIVMQILLTTETTDVDQALFKVKSPGWLAAVTAAVKAATRDFIGGKELQKINELKAEADGPGSGKTEFQIAIDVLNDPKTGNPSLSDSFGQKIVTVNFIDYKITNTPAGPHQKAVARYEAAMDAEAAVFKAKKVVTEKEAEAQGIRLVKGAEADMAAKMRDAVKDNPHAGELALADAIRYQEKATTLILNSAVTPMKGI